jgi:hypothetical protein NreA
MTTRHAHATHPAIIKRLKRADGHLKSVVAMIEEGRDCVDVAQQLHAVESAIAQAKRTLIHDHIDHCLSRGNDADEAKDKLSDADALAEFRAITKYL